MTPTEARRLRRLLLLAGLALLLAACSSGAPSSRRTTQASTAPSTSGPVSSTTTSASTPTTTPTGPVGGPVPAGFQPQSVTFVSLSTGWLLGSAPCARPPCTSVVRTRDGGRAWRGVPGPPAALSGDPVSAAGVSEIRFADASNGWAFGPDLYSTHDGGGHWQRETLPAPAAGYAVVSLEAGGGAVLALAVPRPGGTGPAILFRQPAAGGAWAAEPGAAVPGGQRGRVVLQGSSGWLAVVTSQGATTFLSRQADGWQRRSLPCSMPTEALSAASPTDLAVVCGGAGAAGSQQKDVYVSHDAGSTFALAGHAPLAGDLEDVAFGPPTTIVIAAASGASVLHGSFDGGRTWATVAQEASGGLPWRDLGFTDPTHAEVILGTAASQFAGQAPSQLFMSSDGGHSWSAVAV